MHGKNDRSVRSGNVFVFVPFPVLQDHEHSEYILAPRGSRMDADFSFCFSCLPSPFGNGSERERTSDRRSCLASLARPSALAILGGSGCWLGLLVSVLSLGLAMGLVRETHRETVSLLAPIGIGLVLALLCLRLYHGYALGHTGGMGADIAFRSRRRHVDDSYDGLYVLASTVAFPTFVLF